MYRIFRPNHPSTSSDMLQSLPRFYSNQNEWTKQKNQVTTWNDRSFSAESSYTGVKWTIFIPNRDATCTTELHPNITISILALDRCFFIQHFFFLIFFSRSFALSFYSLHCFLVWVFSFSSYFSLFCYIACSKNKKKLKPFRMNTAQIEIG